MKKSFAALAVLGLAACTSVSTNAPASLFQTAPEAYTLGSGDRVRVTVYGETDLTNTYSVSDAGTVSMPLIGAVPTAGLTPQALETAIESRLKKKFVRNPDVSVQVERYRPFFVMGEVRTAGQYSYVPNMTANEAIAIGGGFSERGSRSSVAITRIIDGQQKTALVPLSTPVLPGDTVTVVERLF